MRRRTAHHGYTRAASMVPDGTQTPWRTPQTWPPEAEADTPSQPSQERRGHTVTNPVHPNRTLPLDTDYPLRLRSTIQMVRPSSPTTHVDHPDGAHKSRPFLHSLPNLPALTLTTSVSPPQNISAWRPHRLARPSNATQRHLSCHGVFTRQVCSTVCHRRRPTPW
jgi:hypothetical protein